MSTIVWLIFWLCGLLTIAYHRLSLAAATGLIAAGLVLTTFFSHLSWVSLLLCWMIFGGIAFILHHPEYKRRFITLPIFKAMSRNIPTLSETEKVALEAGTVGWDGELFSGNPEWEKLLTIPIPKLNEEESDFLATEVKQLCEMVNDWEVTHEKYDLPDHVWTYLKENGFFALVIPKKYGGKGFSEFAHSEILATLAGRSLTLASTVAVPNSLGPAELLLRYGTNKQREYYLPRLAKGIEVPCFALTGPEAGSDAGSITDTGILCKGHFEGEEILGIKLNWNKRYITLAPIATLIGLAFKLYDPDLLLGDKKELGITCALIPVITPNITIGRRHLPTTIPFQNGPTQGQDVFIPLEWIIGGPSMAGQGWRMLVECLSTGRAISLPSSTAGSARIGAMVAGGYARIRRQFRTHIGAFEGIQEALARIGGFTYICEAVRCFTVATIDAGERPTVPGAIAKYHVTELGRKIASHAMDVLGGKAIMMGPKNYLGRSYQGAPIGITVEGANILTRSMIIFGQGAIRCHPYLLQEIHATEHQNINDFEHHLGQHVSFTLSNAARSFFHALTFAQFVQCPNHGSKAYYQQLARASSAFALVADLTMALLGGKLKFKEALSGRLGDLLAMMYILSAVLKHHRDQGARKEDLPLVQWAAEYCLAKYWHTMRDFLHNLPNPWLASALKILVMPFGPGRYAPNDKLHHQVSDILTKPSQSRARLMGNSFVSAQEADPLALIEEALIEITEHDALLKRVYGAIKNNDLAQGSLKKCIEMTLNSKIITEEEASLLYHVDSLCQAVVAVDDFSPDELSKKTRGTKTETTRGTPTIPSPPLGETKYEQDHERLN